MDYTLEVVHLCHFLEVEEQGAKEQGEEVLPTNLPKDLNKVLFKILNSHTPILQGGAQGESLSVLFI